MKTLDQHLREQPLVMLRAIARNQGLIIAATGRSVFRQTLVREMLETQHVVDMWQDLAPSAHEAVQTLFSEDNRIAVTSFQRRFGTIRRFGPGHLQKEKPWKLPANVAERLWYLGLIIEVAEGESESLSEFFSIPSDLFQLLPLSLSIGERFAFPPATDASPLRTERDGEERFLDDLATILIYLQNNRVWVNSRGEWRENDLQQLIPRLQTQPLNLDRPLTPGSRLSLLFHCTEALDLVTATKGRLRLQAEAILSWLELDRLQQQSALFEAWRNSSDWNDLCLTPGLHCESGNWRNDPKATRGALLDILTRVQPGQWRNLDALIAAIRTQHPDFQRPDGNYDTWYIRDDTGSYLSGFDHWEDVEGRLI